MVTLALPTFCIILFREEMVGFHEVDNRPINPKNLWVASGARVKNFLNRDERVG